MEDSMVMEAPNAALREHVTSHSFVLTLRKTHIKGLTIVAAGDRQAAMLFGPFVTAMRQLGDRGLVQHTPPVGMAKNIPFSQIYSLTKAGELTYGLLVEAGLAPPLSKRGRKAA